MRKNVLQKSVTCFILVICIHSFALAAAVPLNVSIVTAKTRHGRIDFGVKKLTEALRRAGYTVKPGSGTTISVGLNTDAQIKQKIVSGKINFSKKPGKEGYVIGSSANNIVIAGTDNSGALYGCIELANRIDAAHTLPAKINFVDQPEMVLRGACIGLQKPALLPNRGVYEYPYTPENFPWFYDKALWIRYLDMMVENRMNSLYLWNGHPFASLVKLKDYPYAVEVDDATFKRNEEVFKFLTEEADKRGIWVIQMFYNIIVSRPFADKNKLKTQDRNRPIIPIISDYTRKSIAAFVEKYPNVGLMCALGEAMEGVGQDDIDWFTKTIIPGVKDGLKALGKTEEPPIVLRAHDTDAPAVMKAALPLYKNLYTEAKFNGEALTTYEPHGTWAELHRTLSRIGTVQIENIHIMANLEPFRYGSPDFVQKCVLAMHNTYEANGLHLYPQASYWDWPYTADNANGKRILQLDRDWIWYKEWSRYAWNAHRDRKAEIEYWSGLLAQKYGTTHADAKLILAAYEHSGEISPQILRRVGITDGNRQTMTLGMLMQQFVNPEKFGLFSLLYNSEAPVGEILSEYAEREWKHQPHVGETPLKVADSIVVYGKRAVDAIGRAAKGVKKDDAEFARLKNDMYCYDAMANSYSHKIKAAIHVLRYKYSDDVADLEKAVPEMETSLNYFEELVKLTKDSYLYANSMQTRQRKIPVPGTDAKMKTWVELLPVYQAELAAFKKNIAKLKSTKGETKVDRAKLTDAEVTINGNIPRYSLLNGQAYTDSARNKVLNVAPELADLHGVQLSRSAQVKDGTTITFTNAKPLKVLVGYFVNKDNMYLQSPQLETDASANDFGQADIKITGAIQVAGMPPVNVHTYSFKAGTNTLTLGKGAALVLGFVSDEQKVPVYDAGLSNEGNIKDLRWLFN